MVQRHKRSMSAGQAKEMQRELRDFHRRVQRWCADVPTGTTIYIALQNLNDGLILADCQCNVAIDGARSEPPV